MSSAHRLLRGDHSLLQHFFSLSDFLLNLASDLFSFAFGSQAAEAWNVGKDCSSSVVVGKLGTATLTPDELLESFHQRNG